jgi:hypothetical protein
MVLHRPVETTLVIGNFSGTAGIRQQYPNRGQPPSHQNDLAFASVAVQSNDGLKGPRRYVPRRSKVRHNRTVDREEFCDLLLIGTSNITTAHGASLHRALGAHVCPVYRFWSPEDLRALMPSVASDPAIRSDSHFPILDRHTVPKSASPPLRASKSATSPYSNCYS